MKKNIEIVNFTLLCFALLVGGCSSKTDHRTSKVNSSDQKKGLKKSESSLPGKPRKIKMPELSPELKKVVESGDLLLVEYSGKLEEGKVFDTNIGNGRPPFVFEIGKGTVIKGWEDGLLGMRKGQTINLKVSWKDAYGEKGYPPVIPPKADLYFDIKLLDMVKKGEETVYEKKDLRFGEGPKAKRGNRLTVHYKGKFLNDVEFDSSKNRGEPFQFVLGEGQVIPGWDYGLEGTQAGCIRRLKIPPAIAYGSAGSGPIGPNQVLIFEVEVLKIERMPGQ